MRRYTTTSTTVGTDWMERAACVGRLDIDYFDIDCSLQAALETCAVCPVGDICLQYAIEHKLDEGIWGGAWGDELFGIVHGRRRGRARDA